MSSTQKDLRKSLKALLNDIENNEPETLLDHVYANIQSTGGTSPDDDDETEWEKSMFVKEGSDVLGLVLNGQSKMSKALGSSSFTAMQALTEMGKKVKGLQVPQIAGTRVRFVASLGAVLTYDNVPDPEIAGTVITVKTADGPLTDLDGRVFVAWDDGEFRTIQAEHLRLAGPSRKHASTVRMFVSNLGDISGLFKNASNGEELIHKATKDLWSFKQNGDGYVISRLFDDTGKPLKV